LERGHAIQALETDGREEGQGTTEEFDRRNVLCRQDFSTTNREDVSPREGTLSAENKPTSQTCGRDCQVGLYLLRRIPLTIL